MGTCAAYGGIAATAPNASQLEEKVPEIVERAGLNPQPKVD